MKYGIGECIFNTCREGHGKDLCTVIYKIKANKKNEFIIIKECGVKHCTNTKNSWRRYDDNHKVKTEAPYVKIIDSKDLDKFPEVLSHVMAAELLNN